MKHFEGGYYIAILELLEDIEKKEYHGKELFKLFEERFGSGNYLNFGRALRNLIKNNEISRSKPKEFNRRYYKLIKRKKKNKKS